MRQSVISNCSQIEIILRRTECAMRIDLNVLRELSFLISGGGDGGGGGGEYGKGRRFFETFVISSTLAKNYVHLLTWDNNVTIPLRRLTLGKTEADVSTA